MHNMHFCHISQQQKIRVSFECKGCLSEYRLLITKTVGRPLDRVLLLKRPPGWGPNPFQHNPSPNITNVSFPGEAHWMLFLTLTPMNRFPSVWRMAVDKGRILRAQVLRTVYWYWTAWGTAMMAYLLRGYFGNYRICHTYSLIQYQGHV